MKQFLLAVFIFTITPMISQIKLSDKSCILVSNDSIVGNVDISNIFNAEVHHFFSFPNNCFINTLDDYENGRINWESPDGNFKMSKGIKELKGYDYPRDSYNEIDFDKIDLSKIQSIIESEFETIISDKSQSMDKVYYDNICSNEKEMVLIGLIKSKIVLYKTICASVSGGTFAFVQLEIEYPKTEEKDYNGVSVKFLNSFKNDL